MAAPAESATRIETFLALDGIAGGSVDRWHPDEIEVASFGWGVTATSVIPGGGGRRRRRREVDLRRADRPGAQQRRVAAPVPVGALRQGGLSDAVGAGLRRVASSGARISSARSAPRSCRARSAFLSAGWVKRQSLPT